MGSFKKFVENAYHKEIIMNFKKKFLHQNKLAF